jgi:DNA-binding CsgD family transcriptional regulator
MSASAPSPPPLVGRDREQTVLHERLHSTIAGQGNLVLIGGEAGIGKTTLAEDTCHEATEQGMLVLIGRCYDLTETPPYGAWIELFARYRPIDDLPPLPDAFARRGTVGDVASQVALFQQVLDFFTALTETRSLVLLLDDLHWADPASLDLLRFLARSAPTLPLLIIGTYRADELTRRHPLYQLLPILARETTAARIDLKRLEQADLRALVTFRYALSEADTSRLVAYLQARSEGNPFFLGELLRTLEAERALQRIDTRWSVADLSRVRVPLLLRQVIDGRLARLDEEVQSLLASAAVIGQDIPLTLWTAVAEADEEQVVAAIEQAAEAHLVVEAADGRGIAFIHALIREALYEGVMPSRRRVWHRKVGEVLAARSNPDPDAIAHHFQQAGDLRAAHWLIQAGARADRAYAWVTAIERFERALAIMEEHGADAGERGWLLYRIARLHRFAAPRRALANLEASARMAATAGDRALAAICLVDQGLNRIFLHDYARGLAELAAGVEATEVLPAAEQARLEQYDLASTSVHGMLMFHLAGMGYLTEVLAVAERNVIGPEPASSSTASGGSDLADRYGALGATYALLGRPDESHRAFVRARDTYRTVEHYVLVGWTCLYELDALTLPYHTDQIRRRRELAAAGEEAWTRASSGALASSQPPRLAWVPALMLEGEWDEVRSLTSAVLESEYAYWRDYAVVLAGQLARDQGEPDLAWQQILALLPTGPATEPGTVPFRYGMMIQRLAVALALDAHDFPVAEQWLRAHDRWLAWRSARWGTAEGQVLWARYHRLVGNASLAHNHVSAAIAHANEPRQPLALIDAHRLLSELYFDACRYQDAARHLTEAMVLANACAAPFARARTLLALAEVHAVTGMRAEAKAYLDEVHAICTPLGAKPTLDRANALADRLVNMQDIPPRYPAGLSAREVEVLRLVASGLTNAQVAERLFLSPRTINAHLTTIYTKLNVPSRAAAIRFALDHGLR